MPRRNSLNPYDRQSISLSLNAETLAGLRAFCDAKHVSISSLVEAALFDVADRLAKGIIDLDVVRWNVVRIIEPGEIRTSELLARGLHAAAAKAEAEA